MEAMTKVEVLRAACCVSGVDGKAGNDERPILDMLAREVGVGEASLRAMIDRAETEPEYIDAQFRVLKADPIETMKLLFSVALADRKLTEKEIDVLRKLSQKLDVPTERFDAMLAKANQIMEQ